MENLEIISTQVTVQAKRIINENTANFSWNHEQGSLPQTVNFNVQRGVNNGEGLFSGNNVITGAYYAQSKKFDIQNNNFNEGDLLIYNEILTVCQSIVEEIEETAKLLQ